MEKFFEYRRMMILLVSENPAYDIEPVTEGDVIVGRVAGVWQNLA